MLLVMYLNLCQIYGTSSTFLELKWIKNCVKLYILVCADWLLHACRLSWYIVLVVFMSKTFHEIHNSVCSIWDVIFKTSMNALNWKLLVLKKWLSLRICKFTLLMELQDQSRKNGQKIDFNVRFYLFWIFELFSSWSSLTKRLLFVQFLQHLFSHLVDFHRKFPTKFEFLDFYTDFCLESKCNSHLDPHIARIICQTIWKLSVCEIYGV